MICLSLMKALFIILLILCVFLLLENSHNDSDCKTIRIISFIDDLRCSNNKIIVKLFEFPTEMVLNAAQSEKQFSLICNAFKLGKPLCFCITANAKIITCYEADTNQAKAYLDDFKPLQSPLKCMQYCQNTCLTKISDSFRTKYMKIINSNNTLCNLEKGCEFRSQMVTEFLQKIVKLKSYKLFLKGDLHANINGERLNWRHHVVNLLLIENGKEAEFKVFDPWTLNTFPKLNVYLKSLTSNGSLISDCYITEADVFTVCFSSGYALKCDSLKAQSVTFN